MIQVPDELWKAITRYTEYETTRKKGYDIAFIITACFSIGCLITLFMNLAQLMKMFYIQ